MGVGRGGEGEGGREGGGGRGGRGGEGGGRGGRKGGNCTTTVTPVPSNLLNCIFKSSESWRMLKLDFFLGSIVLVHKVHMIHVAPNPRMDGPFLDSKISVESCWRGKTFDHNQINGYHIIFGTNGQQPSWLMLVLLRTLNSLQNCLGERNLLQTKNQRFLYRLVHMSKNH